MSGTKELVNQFIDHAQSIINDPEHVMSKELRAIHKLFGKYDEDGIRDYFKKYLSDDKLIRSVVSFNSSMIERQSIELAVKSAKKVPKIRLGSLYRKAEELSKTVIEQSDDGDDDGRQAHVILMIRFLSIFDSIEEGNRFSSVIGIYEQMRGNQPEPNELMGLLNMVPGFQSGITNFLPPEFFTKVKTMLAENGTEDMSPDKIKVMVTEVLDSIPAIAPQKEFLTGLLTKLFENPEMVTQFTQDPSSIVSLLTAASPFGSSSNTDNSTPSPSVDVNAMMMNNPYA